MLVKEKETAKVVAPAPAVVAPINNAPKIVAAKPATNDLPPLDERLHRLNQLFEIQGKYNRLQASLLKLKAFTFNREGDYKGLSIRDEEHNEFSTGNPEVCGEVIKFLVTTIEAKIKEVEPLLKW